MQFAIALLVVLAIACSIGSFVTQGQSFNQYAAQYSERAAAFIIALGLDDAFHSWWFILINAFLCCNLLFCNVIRLPQILKRVKTDRDAGSVTEAAADISAQGVNDPNAFFEKMRHSKPAASVTSDGKDILYSPKNTAGNWGAWICHIGILLLILGFSLSQFLHQEYAVYGVPGDARPIGDTGYVLQIDGFEVGLRDDDTVEQYTADITVYDVNHSDSGSSQSAEISVNNPAKLFGMKFYQNSTGWAARVSVTENGEPLQDKVLCAGEYLAVQDKPDLVIYFNAFYPDFYVEPGNAPVTLSGKLNNPGYLYSVYYQGNMLGMNVLMGSEPLTIDEYTVVFSEPQSYTVIQVKQDRFAWLAFIGGIVILAGLVLAFYVLPEKVWAVKETDGQWTVYGSCRKGGALFKERFEEAAEEFTRQRETEDQHGSAKT